MRKMILVPLALVLIAAVGCGDDSDTDDSNTVTNGTTVTSGAGGATSTTTGVGGGGSGGSTGGSACDLAANNGAALQAFLDSGGYTGWQAEAAVHASAGPHGSVRTFVNDVLFSSLSDGNVSHPQCSAAVKELYSGNTLNGYAVEIKVQADSANGQGWYWYEIIGANVVANGLGEGGCTGCHSSGADYVRTPFPLQ